MADITGTTGSETLTGTPENDVIDGNGGGDLMIGLGGDDWYAVRHPSDQVDEEAGEGFDQVFAYVSWTLNAGAHVEVLQTTNHTYTDAIDLTGNALGQTLYGNAGGNILDGKGGADVLHGLGGIDHFTFTTALGGGNVDEIADFEAGVDRILLDNSVFAGVTAGNLANVFVVGTAAQDSDDRLIYDSAAGQLFYDGDGNGAGAQILFATLSGPLSSGDFLVFNNVSETIHGDAGNNILDGGGGGDVMIGLGGDDWYLVRHPADRVIEEAGGGFDQVFAYVSWTLTAGSRVEVLQTSNHTNTFAIDLTGNEFSQTIYGNAGDNILDGNGGGDVMYGRGGNDSYGVRTGSDFVFENAGEGWDQVYAYASYVLGVGQEIEVLQTSNHTNTFAINLTGNELGQTIYGNDGNNIIDGNGGGDVMVGNGGDDLYLITHASDLVHENAGDGYDKVITHINWTLSAGSHVEALHAANPLTTAALDLTGNEFNQYIRGTAGANTLDSGGGGDALEGGAGDDRYVVRSVSDRVFEVSRGGFDQVYAYVSYTLRSDADIEVLQTSNQTNTFAIDLTGNNISQQLYGNAGVNTLDGGGGGDRLAGLGGDDLYVARVGSDLVFENAGEGFDQVYAYASWTLNAGSHVEVVQTHNHTYTTAIDLTGNALGQTLYGNAGANILDGKAGADVLQGYGGADGFQFTTALGGGNVDRIVDFQADLDKIRIDDAVFAGVTQFNLANVFVAGTAAQDADDRLIYDSATGQLFYDGDGNGAGAQILFATLSGPLTAADFVVI